MPLTSPPGVAPTVVGDSLRTGAAPSTVPGSTSGSTTGDYAYFDSGGASSSVTLDVTRSLSGFEFKFGTPDNYNINAAAGASFLLTNNGSIVDGITPTIGTTRTETVNAPLVLEPNGGAGSLNSGSYTLSNNATSQTGDTLLFQGTIMGGSASTMTLNLTGSNALGLDTISALISNGSAASFNVTVQSGTAATWDLTNTNTYTGVTTISGGTLTTGTGGIFGVEGSSGGVASSIGAASNAAGNLVLDGGTLQWAHTVSNGSTDRLFTLTANGGTLNASGNYQSAITFTNTGAIAYSGTGTRTLTLTGYNVSGTSAVDAFDPLLADSDVTHATSLAKTGIGAWTVNNSNTYSGGTTVSDGTLTGGGAGAFGTGFITINPNVATGSISDNAALSSNNSIGSFAAVTVNSEIGDSGDGVGALYINSGSQTIGSLAGNGNVLLTKSSASSLTIGNGNTASTTFSGVISASNAGSRLVAIGTGTLTLSNTNTYAGGTTVTDGTLIGTGTGAFGTGNISVNPTAVTGTAADNATLSTLSSIATTATVTVNSEASDGGFGIGAVIFNDAAPTIATLSGTGSVVLNGASGTALTTGTTGNPTFSGTISDDGTLTNSGSITVTGAGTFTLSGTSTYFGSTNVNGGSLNITGALANSGTVNVSNSSNLVLTGASALPSSAIVNIGSLASAYVNSSQTIASIVSAGNATFSAGTSIIGQGNGIGIGTGTAGFSGGITSTGNLTVTGTANLYASTITQNLLTIGSGRTVTIADSSAPGNSAATSVLTDISNAGTLDLNNNDLIVLDTAQYSTVKNLIVNAYDGGAWDQPGITSSSARTNSGSYGLGYAQASTIGSTNFDGQTFTDAVLVKYTLLGDTQLRGTVGLGDYDTVLSNYGTPQDWSGGNFHYAGVVGLGDYDAVLTNYGAHASGNLAVGPSLTRGISPAASINPDLAKTDLKLEVNIVTGDVYIVTTASAAFTGYTISDPSAHLLGGSTSPDPDKLLSVSAGNGGNTNVYETSGTTVNWFKITETASQVAEGQQQNGFATHSSRDDTINIPAGGTIDFGEIYNTAASAQDITFDFAEAGTTPTNGPTYYGAEVDYINPIPEPATMGLLGLGGLMTMRRRRRTAVFQ